MYQTYYNETIIIAGRHYIGKKVLDKVFDTEAEAERHCRNCVGIQAVGDNYIEHELNYEEVFADTKYLDI